MQQWQIGNSKDSLKMDVTNFYRLVNTQDTPDESDLPQLKILVDRFPYFQAGLFVYLKCLYAHDYDLFRPELLRLAMFISDRKAFFYYILNEEYGKFFKKREYKELPKDRTTILMDAFFESINDNTDEKELEQALTNSNLASLDYFSYIQSLDNKSIDDAIPPNSNEDGGAEKFDGVEASQQTENKVERIIDNPNLLKHQNIIDSFINKAEEDGNDLKIVLEKDESRVPEIDDDETDLEEMDDDDIFFTETLANIYIKQRKYEKAYEIIKRLSLNYPKKNIYFADQLSFLEKLINNTKRKK